MSSGKAKYDPLEAAKLGGEKPPAPPAEFTTPKAEAAAKATASAADAAPPPKPKLYRLVEDKTTSIRGLVCNFKAGRVFSEQGYDIAELMSKGLKLEIVKE